MGLKTLTVGDLCDLVSDPRIDRDLEVVLRVCDDEEGETMVGGLTGASVDAGCAERESFILDGDYHADSEFWCRQCRSEVDPEVCHCGEEPDASVHRQMDGHAFVPMGCRCGEHRAPEEKPRESISANVDVVSLRAARLKLRELRREIESIGAGAVIDDRVAGALATLRANMLHSISKLGQFVEEAVGERVFSAAGPADTGGGQ